MFKTENNSSVHSFNCKKIFDTNKIIEIKSGIKLQSDICLLSCLLNFIRLCHQYFEIVFYHRVECGRCDRPNYTITIPQKKEKYFTLLRTVGLFLLNQRTSNNSSINKRVIRNNCMVNKIQIVIVVIEYISSVRTRRKSSLSSSRQHFADYFQRSFGIPETL